MVRIQRDLYLSFLKDSTHKTLGKWSGISIKQLDSGDYIDASAYNGRLLTLLTGDYRSMNNYKTAVMPISESGTLGTFSYNAELPQYVSGKRIFAFAK